MNPIKMTLTALFSAFRMLCLMIAGIGIATAAPRAIPTFHCMSLEWPQPAGSTATVCAVEYRTAGASSWTTGHPLMWDGTEQQYRGSVVGLTSGTGYEFRLSIPGQAAVTLSKSTWSDAFPIATETVLPAGTITSTYVINSGGTASGWKVYKAHPSGTTIDVGNPTTNVIPGEARARLNIRFNDLHTPESLIGWLQQEAVKVAAETGTEIAVTPQISGVSFLTAPGDFTALVSDAVKSVTGAAPVFSTSGGTSDARFIKDTCPVVELGLAGATMHKVDECVPVAEITALADIYTALLEAYFDNPPK